MRVAFVYDEVPNLEHSTDTTCAFLLLNAIMEAGHDLHVLLFLPSHSLISDPTTRQRWLDQLASRVPNLRIESGDVLARPISHGQARRLGLARQLLLPQLENYFPHMQLRPQVEKHLRSVSPDVVFLWGNWPPVAATHNLGIAPRLAFVGDPPHMPALYRLRPPLSPQSTLLSLRYWASVLRLRQQGRMSVALLSRCEGTAATAAHHAEWFRRNGVPRCKYLPNVMPDWGGANWRERRKNAPKGDKFRIVHVGHLGGTATRAGLHLFAKEVLPVLERELGNAFEVHVCGKGNLDPDVEPRLRRPSVVMRGFVDDIVSELLSSDVFVVPTPIPLGIRVRIPYAWSVGSCVVAHRANASGLPELQHGKNSLLAGTGEGLAREIVRLFRDQELRTALSEGARKSYDEHFSYEVTTGKFLRELESTAAKQGVS